MDAGEPKRDDVFVRLQICNNNNKKALKIKTERERERERERDVLSTL